MVSAKGAVVRHHAGPQGMQGSAAHNKNLSMPDKNKYNFMGVSSIKQGEEQQQDGSNRPNIQNSGGRDGL